MTVPTITHLQALVLSRLVRRPMRTRAVHASVQMVGRSPTMQAFQVCTAVMEREGLIELQRIPGPTGGPGREKALRLTRAGREALRGAAGFYRELEAVA